MRVGRSDQAELVGIDAEFLFQLEAVLQRGTGILEFEHLRFLERGQVQVALVPTLEVGELIVGREERMRLAVALDLGRFVEVLPLGALFGILAVNLLARGGLDDREHAPVAQVPIVGEREHVAAGLLLVSGHPLPEIARVVAAERLLRGVRLGAEGLVRVVAEDDVAMEVVSGGDRGPLEADEGREAARIVRPFGRLNSVLPDRAINGRAGQRHDFRRDRSLGKGRDEV